MKLFEIFIIAVGLSMDACAVAICLGLNMQRATIKKALIVGAYFGVFQAAMPLIGYLVAALFADKIKAFDHWIAFALLVFLGGKMIIGSFEKQDTGCLDRKCPNGICTDRHCPGKPKETSLAIAKMLPFAFATSIDALAVGVSFAFLKVEIFSAISIIGLVTLALSTIGIKIGNMFGTKIKSKAELFGGAILIIIGLKILLEHLLGG